MNEEDGAIDGTLPVTSKGTVPAPDWYVEDERRVEIVTSALTVVIEGWEGSDRQPMKPAGETAPFPMNLDPWHDY